jgi:hypothetical protein
MSIDEAIAHAEEAAVEKAEQAREAQLQEEYSTIKSCKECADEHIQLAGWLIELKQLREQTRWIPCSEKMPEEMGTYMTTIDYGEHGLVAGQRYYYGKGLKWNDECVIAWMPLPEPYEAEMEGEE